MSQLPFKLYNNHKTITRCLWKKLGLIMDNFEEIYNNYIIATHCDLCGLKFKNTRERQMDHCHETGQFRNIVCRSCNHLKADYKFLTHNTSGYRGISKRLDKQMKQGFRWVFIASINGKNKQIKTSGNFDKLVEFAEKWKKDNNYYK